jgi:segregation and condensation protein A
MVPAMTAGSIADYQVVLDTFRGPLDLLLYLVKREEVDVLDIPIARVADQFKQHLDFLHLIDVERAGDFLVLAATLMEIKSKMLLPRTEEAAEEAEDPRRELVKQLLLYKRVKEGASALERREEERQLRLPRLPPPEPKASAGTAPVAPVELWDLVSAFGRLMRETMAQQPQAVVVDHTPLSVHMDNVLAQVKAAGRPVTLAELFTPPHTRSRLVGLFQAILELAKIKAVLPEQAQTHGDIVLRINDEFGMMNDESRQQRADAA